MTIDAGGTERKYRNHEPIPSDELIEKAAERMRTARKNISQTSPLASAMDDILIQIPTSAIDTLAVTLLPDGFAAQLYNPDFVLRCATIQDLVFIRTHEMYHLFLGHLWSVTGGRDEIRVMAEEIVINDRVSCMYSPNTHPRHWKMPLVTDPDKGKDIETGVHPFKMYEKYRKDLNGEGLDPVEYSEFVSTDVRCEAELRRMKNPPTPRGASSCPAGPCASGSQQGGGSGDSGDTPHHPHQDASVLGESVEGAVEKVMKKAIESRGNDSRSKNELLSVMDTTADSDLATQLWGDLGAGALRGETVVQKKVSFWEQYLQNSIHERIKDGERLQFNEALIAFPGPPRVSSIGEETYKKGVIAVDTSGSMDHRVLEYIAELLGEEENLEFTVLAFDGVVWPFTLGEPLLGGGGTNFGIIEEHILKEYDQYPDFVIVCTDGYAPAITPSQPDRWVWLITEGGDPWPERHDVPMDTVIIDDEELSRAAACSM